MAGRPLWILLPCAVLLVAFAAGAQESHVLKDRLLVVAPAAEGSGWHLTAQAMKESLENAGIVGQVDIERSPGAGGLIGLAQFIEARRGDPDAVIIGGSFMIGAAQFNQSSVSMLDATPIARLTGDFASVAVPTNSVYGDFDDLLLVLQSQPRTINWVGGSAGGADQQFLWRLADALNIDRDELRYQSRPGGGDVATALAAGRFDVGISGYGEFQPMIDDGKLRVLAVAAPHPLSETNVPTLDELGVIGVSQMNWRGLFAAPSISEQQRELLDRIILAMVQSPQWQKVLQRYRWDDVYLGRGEFLQFLQSEQDPARRFDGQSGTGSAEPRLLPSALARRHMLAIALGAVAVLLLLVLYSVWTRNRKRVGDLRYRLKKIGQDAKLNADQLNQLHAGISARISSEFDKWELTPAERSVASLLLKGMRLKEIAKARSTSERTVRQQAQSVYQKAGLDGRTELAAYFLEDYLPPDLLRG